MKYKKYILLLLFLIIIGINPVKADEKEVCYYSSSDKEANAIVTMKSSPSVTINSAGGGRISNKESIINWKSSETKSGVTLSAISNTKKCPTYLIVRKGSGFGVFASEEASAANDFANNSKSDGMLAWILTYTNADGSKRSAIEYDTNVNGSLRTNKEQADYNQMAGKVDCNDIFGDKNDPDSLRSIIDEVLLYIRIIIPVLVITFGTVDLAKAVFASKEDEMKKAQKTFVKRVIIGAVFFFIPFFIDMIMSLADIVWSGAYSTCGLD